MLSFKEKREIQKQIKQGYASLVGAKFSEKRAIQKDIKSLYSKLNGDGADTKKTFDYSEGDVYASKHSSIDTVILQVKNEEIIHNFRNSSTISHTSMKDFEKDFEKIENVDLEKFKFSFMIPFVKKGHTINEHGELSSDVVDTKKPFIYSVGDKVIVGNGTTDDRGTILNKDEHDTAFKGLNINEYEAVEMSDGQVQIVGHSRMKLDTEKPTKKYTSHLAILKKETITAKEIEDLINDDSLSNIDAEIEQGNTEALELSNALDEAIERHNTKTDSITQTLGEFGLEQHSLDDGTSILYKDSIEVFRSSDDESVGEYLDSIQWQRENIQGEGGV